MTAPTPSPAVWLLEQESRAILDRLARLRPFAAVETMVPAAAPSPLAQASIDRFLLEGRTALRSEIEAFRAWLRGPGASAPPAEQQRRFTVIRMRFNTELGHFDLFSDALTQRSESDGILLAGLDVAAADALQVVQQPYDDPPVLCYLDRGPGGAIRRARTRLPGGRSNPVALIRVPRERMVGHGIASSLMHEVGHQGAALLGLVESLQRDLKARTAAAPPAQRRAWALWERWVSETIADVWSIGRVGVSSTLGLIGVVSLPSFFVFRVDAEDPHATPWLRVLASCAFGEALYPHPQWGRIAQTWAQAYPIELAPAASRPLLGELQAVIPGVAAAILAHRPPPLGGRTLRETLAFGDRSPASLLQAWELAAGRVERLAALTPARAFAVLGQARLAGRVTPERESELLTRLLRTWALRSALDVTATGARGLTVSRRPTPAVPAPVRQLIPTH